MSGRFKNDASAESGIICTSPLTWEREGGQPPVTWCSPVYRSRRLWRRDTPKSSLRNAPPTAKKNSVQKPAHSVHSYRTLRTCSVRLKVFKFPTSKCESHGLMFGVDAEYLRLFICSTGNTPRPPADLGADRHIAGQKLNP